MTTAPLTSAPPTTARRASQRTVPTLPVLPALVAGHVAHHRGGPVRHAFRHGVYQWLVDLDALPEMPWYLKPFASFSAGDHLGDPDLSIKANVERCLSLNGISLGESSRIVMLANARVLGHVFDPLSVFWCFEANNSLACIVAEVHNTYGERHVYLLPPDASGVATADKSLYVSPFFDVSGRYEMRFGLSPAVVSSTVILRREGKVAFTATFRGRPKPATRMAVMGQIVRKPLMPQQISAMIRMHGIWLWLRRLPIVRRPIHEPQEGV
ncbi:MAG TPA: DUF1365 domain-containing protein [Dermatophilaceae bacterium]|nr:DUF1365 domain-containing protein [Dermatophilaceae bacterium]